MVIPCEELPPHLKELCCGDSPRFSEKRCAAHAKSWLAKSTTAETESNLGKLPTSSESPIQAARLLPCIHRGDTYRTDKCRACGAKDKDAPVHKCNKHGECTITDFKLPRIKVCRACTDFVPRNVSVIITARNYGKFLREAIESALGQSVPVEVIYSDDFSEDDSVEIARRYEERGVIVLTAPKHLGVAEARNRGVAASTGEYLVHLDGDDKMAEFFVEDHLKAMAPGIPFVYGPARAFGDGPRVGTLWGVPEWKDCDLWAGNSVNTSAMYARWAFDAAGGWRDGIGTMWDWDLAIRAARHGKPRTSTAILDYRQHPESFSHQTQEASDERRHGFQSRMRRLNATLSIGTIVSGRVPGLFDEWFHRLCETVTRSGVKADLTILDNSTNPAFSKVIRRVSGHPAFSFVRIVSHPERFTWDSEVDRRNKVADFMARACNRLTSYMRGDLVWFVEDDVMVPGNALQALRDALVGHVESPYDCPHAVSGAYRSRHDRTTYIAGWKRGKEWPHVESLPVAPTPIDYAGTGCLMFWRQRPAIPETFVSHAEGIPAHDWAWGMELRKNGGKMLLVPSVKCGHAVSEKEIIP